MKLYMFRTVPLSLIRNYSLYTPQWCMSYRFVDSFRAGSGSWSGSKAVLHTPLLCVQWVTPDDGQRSCPKHVEFHFQNKIWEISVSSWFYYKDIYSYFLSNTVHGPSALPTGQLMLFPVTTVYVTCKQTLLSEYTVYECYCRWIIQDNSGGMFIITADDSIGHCQSTVYTDMCLVLSGYR
jgi:hypothetical protein